MENSTSAHVAQLQSEGKKILVAYTGTWCNICTGLTPRLDEISINYPNINFIELDIDENKDSALEIGITTVPTVLVYDGEILINRSIGSNINSVYTKILDTL